MAKENSNKNGEVEMDKLKGRFVLMVFYPRDAAFTKAVKAFISVKEMFAKVNTDVLVCSTDHTWSTWSTSPGIKLKGVMAAHFLNDDQPIVDAPQEKEVEHGSDAWFDCEEKSSVVILDNNGIVRHVVNSSMAADTLVESCLATLKCFNAIRIRDPTLERKVDKESKFSKKSKPKAFVRKSFHELELDKEVGQLNLLGEADILSQFHLSDLMSRLCSSGGSSSHSL